MTGEPTENDAGANNSSRQGAELNDDMSKAVHQRQQRAKHWQIHGERTIGQNLSMIGSLGWLIVTPTLLGLWLGLAADRAFGSGIFWTSALIFLGVSFGSYLAWRHIEKER